MDYFTATGLFCRFGLTANSWGPRLAAVLLVLAGSFASGAPAPTRIDPAKSHTLRIAESASPELYLKERAGTILFGNSRVEFSFDKRRGGALAGLADKRSATTYTFSGQELSGEWVVEMEGAPFSAATAAYEGGECRFDKGEAVLKLRSSTATGRLTQVYRLKKGDAFLKAGCEFENASGRAAVLQTVRFALGNIAIGGSIEENRFIYPPTWLHFMKGKIGGATAEAMNARYIYGWSQPTDKLMLPYSLIFDAKSGNGLALAAVDGRSKVYVGALGGDSGTLGGTFSSSGSWSPGRSRRPGMSTSAS